MSSPSEEKRSNWILNNRAHAYTWLKKENGEMKEKLALFEQQINLLTIQLGPEKQTEIQQIQRIAELSIEIEGLKERIADEERSVCIARNDRAHHELEIMKLKAKIKSIV